MPELCAGPARCSYRGSEGGFERAHNQRGKAFGDVELSYWTRPTVTIVFMIAGHLRRARAGGENHAGQGVATRTYVEWPLPAQDRRYGGIDAAKIAFHAVPIAPLDITQTR